MSIEKPKLDVNRAMAQPLATRPASPTGKADAQTPVEQPTLEAIRRVAVQLDSYMKSMGRSIQFEVDDASGRTVISVRDSQTGELIRQIPGEEVLRLSRGMDSSSLLVSITA